MASDPRTEPAWETVVSQPPDLPRWLTRLEPVAILVAVLVPLALLAVLGVCAGRQYWRQWLSRPHPSPDASTCMSSRLGCRPGVPADMQYEAEGRAHLGEYSVDLYDPASRTTLRADFALSGETTCAEQKRFERWIARHGRFLREQVMVTVRNGDLKELSGPKQAVLGRKLVARVNRSLGEPFLKSVTFKNFVLYESVRNSDFVLREEGDDTGSIPQ